MRAVLLLVVAACSSEPSQPMDASSTGDSPAIDAPAGDSQMMTTDASDAGDAKVDPCLDRTLCDDFEGTLAKWKILANKGTATIDTSKAYSGKQSLKVSIDPTTAQDTYRRAMIASQGAPLIPLPNDTVYGRFMITTDRIPDKTVKRPYTV